MSRGAYYNEFDPIAAQWLRNLIAAGLIAPGEVDERSIVDVRSSDLVGFTQCHFFAGIGVWSFALRLAGWPDDEEVWTGSCPCQPFSDAGAGEAFDDERDLWPYWFPLIPAADGERGAIPIFGEQVASKDGLAWLDAVHADLESKAYTVGAVDTCSAGFGAPHIRQRFFFVAHPRGERIRDQGRATDARAPGGSEGEGLQRERLRDDARHDGDGGAFALAHAPSGRLDARSERGASPEAIGERKRAFGARPHGAAGDMGDAERARLEGFAGDVDDGREPGRDGALEARPASPASPDGGMADAARPEDWRLHLRRPDEAGPTVDARPGPVNGFWGNAIWIPCRDGRVRPIEPGSFPLAHGAPARVGRLRAYGNAINAEAAIAFIEAYLDVRRAA